VVAPLDTVLVTLVRLAAAPVLAVVVVPPKLKPVLAAVLDADPKLRPVEAAGPDVEDVIPPRLSPVEDVLVAAPPRLIPPVLAADDAGVDAVPNPPPNLSAPPAEVVTEPPPKAGAAEVEEEDRLNPPNAEAVVVVVAPPPLLKLKPPELGVTFEPRPKAAGVEVLVVRGVMEAKGATAATGAGTEVPRGVPCVREPPLKPPNMAPVVFGAAVDDPKPMTAVVAAVVLAVVAPNPPNPPVEGAA